MKFKNDDEYISYLADCGFNSDEISQKIKDRDQMRITMQNKSVNPIPIRDKSCQNYERAQKRLFNQVESFISGK